MRAVFSQHCPFILRRVASSAASNLRPRQLLATRTISECPLFKPNRDPISWSKLYPEVLHRVTARLPGEACSARTRGPPPWALSTTALATVFAATLYGNQVPRANSDAAGQSDAPVLVAEEQELVNWSGTHEVSTKRYYQPQNLDQLKSVVAHCHEHGLKLRPVGSALSPNAIGFDEDGMVNLALMDSVLSIDKTLNRVTVQAGARVSQVVEALRLHGLTLENFASIAEQQIGGFTQIGAHGTGATIPPVDEQVVAIKLITPAVGELQLSIDDKDPSLFFLARTCLGLLGVVAEVTLQCVPSHFLEEKTFTATREQVRANHAVWLRDNKHLRYMWIPHTDMVVVVTCNPVDPSKVHGNGEGVLPKYSEAERLEAARSLLINASGNGLTKAQVEELSFTSLRDELLAIDPLNYEWVRRVNRAEAEFWRRSEGIRIDTSDRILGFDCGGQQWVSEVAFPVYPEHAGSDVCFVESIMKIIEEKKIPAPSPIEQRWTAPSRSPMSPASEKPDVSLPPVYSWVGIIMYLPEANRHGPGELPSSDDDHSISHERRKKITDSFRGYKRECENSLWDNALAVEHWAKIEIPDNEVELARLQYRTARKYPVVAFNAIRELFDPKNILSNDVTEAILRHSNIVADREAAYR